MSDRRKKMIEPISEEILLERQFRLKNEILREVRALFRKLKRYKGLTQREIAQRSGMDPAEISRLLNGKINMTLATLSDLLEGMEAELRIKAVPVESVASEGVAIENVVSGVTLHAKLFDWIEHIDSNIFSTELYNLTYKSSPSRPHEPGPNVRSLSGSVIGVRSDLGSGSDTVEPIPHFRHTTEHAPTSVLQ